MTVFYECDRRDAPYILQELADVGVDEYTYIMAAENLRAGRKDTGLTYSNTKERASVVVISKCSTEAEFANTWVHELNHCSKHIAMANGFDCNSEAPSYIAGELARSMYTVAARLMCPACSCA